MDQQDCQYHQHCCYCVVETHRETHKNLGQEASAQVAGIHAGQEVVLFVAVVAAVLIHDDRNRNIYALGYCYEKKRKLTVLCTVRDDRKMRRRNERKHDGHMAGLG